MLFGILLPLLGNLLQLCPAYFLEKICMILGDASMSTKETILSFFARHYFYSRINLFLVDKLLLQNVAAKNDIIQSDHAVISITHSDRQSSSPIHLWRNNSSVIKILHNTFLLMQHLHEFFYTNSQSVSDPFILYYGMLTKHVHMALSPLSLPPFARMKRQRNQHIAYLLSEIHKLESQNKICPHQNVSFNLI